MTIINGSIYGFDETGSRWGMTMTFETEETSWAAREQRAVGIATLATPLGCRIKWAAYCGLRGEHYPMARDLVEADGPVNPFSTPVGGTNLFECPVPEGTVF